MGIFLAGMKVACAASIAGFASPGVAKAKSQPSAPVAGGYQAADVGDPRVQAAASFAAKEVFGTRVRLRSINSAQRQVVQGMNYKLDITGANGRRWLVTVYQPLRGEMRITQRQPARGSSPVATRAEAQPEAGSASGGEIPSQFQGAWGIGQRACSGPEDTAGRIEMNKAGYSGGSGSAAVVRSGRESGGIHYFDVIFSADGDRQWEGRLALRRVGDRLAVTAIGDGRTQSRSYIRCRR
jgi:hypothetical protein